MQVIFLCVAFCTTREALEACMHLLTTFTLMANWHAPDLRQKKTVITEEVAMDLRAWSQSHIHNSYFMRVSADWKRAPNGLS